MRVSSPRPAQQGTANQCPHVDLPERIGAIGYLIAAHERPYTEQLLYSRTQARRPRAFHLHFLPSKEFDVLWSATMVAFVHHE